jgi:hypothetical protein
MVTVKFSAVSKQELLHFFRVSRHGKMIVNRSESDGVGDYAC